MATQMQLARQGIITEAMLQVAAQEQLAPEVIRAGVAAGTIAVCCNINHKNLVPRGVGPVSYTHLDVYKRQLPVSANLCFGSVLQVLFSIF